MTVELPNLNINLINSFHSFESKFTDHIVEPYHIKLMHSCIDKLRERSSINLMISEESSVATIETLNKYTDDVIQFMETFDPSLLHHRETYGMMICVNSFIQYLTEVYFSKTFANNMHDKKFEHLMQNWKTIANI